MKRVALWILGLSVIGEAPSAPQHLGSSGLAFQPFVSELHSFLAPRYFGTSANSRRMILCAERMRGPGLMSSKTTKLGVLAASRLRDQSSRYSDVCDQQCQPIVPEERTGNHGRGARETGATDGRIDRREAVELGLKVGGIGIAGIGIGLYPASVDAEEVHQEAKPRKKRSSRIGPAIPPVEGPRHHYNAVGGVSPPALVMIVGGFMIPPFQYDSYARALSQLGYAVRVHEDISTIVDPKPLSQSAEALLEETRKATQYEQEIALMRAAQDSNSTLKSQYMKRMLREELVSAEALKANRQISNSEDSVGVKIEGQSPKRLGFETGASENLPIVLVGHSRGAKLCVLAAAALKSKVAAMVLIDPVDGTPFEPDGTLSVLEGLKVPTAVVGGGADPYGQCAPQGANYVSFYRALSVSDSPRLLVEAPNAGHTQFLDNREAMVVDPCVVGKDDDDFLRDMTISVMTGWIASFAPFVLGNLSTKDQEAYLAAKSVQVSDRHFYAVAAEATKSNIRSTLEKVKFRCNANWFSGGGIG